MNQIYVTTTFQIFAIHCLQSSRLSIRRIRAVPLNVLKIKPSNLKLIWVNGCVLVMYFGQKRIRHADREPFAVFTKGAQVHLLKSLEEDQGGEALGSQ
jgi:hypothetical protein